MLVKFKSVDDGEMLINTEWVTTASPIKPGRGGKPSPKCCIYLFTGDGRVSDNHEVYGTLDEVLAKLNAEPKP